MSDTIITDSPGDPAEDLPGFYGAEELQPTEETELEARRLIDDYLSRNPGGQERLIPLLHMVQEEIGYLPFAVQKYIADRLGLSPIQIYGVVSFYHFFTITPRGKHQFKVCMGTACFVRHARRLLETLQKTLDLEVGEVTDDYLFSLEKVRCLGACSLAPAMMVNNDTHGNLTPREARRLVARLQSEGRKEKVTEPGEKSGV